MYIVGRVKADKQNRVNISSLYGPGQIPEEIVLVVDLEREAICILKTSEASDFGIRRKIDGKPRVILPDWMLEELGDNRDFFLIIDDNKKYLSPKTENILSKV